MSVIVLSKIQVCSSFKRYIRKLQFYVTFFFCGIDCFFPCETTAKLHILRILKQIYLFPAFKYYQITQVNVNVDLINRGFRVAGAGEENDSAV